MTTINWSNYGIIQGATQEELIDCDGPVYIPYGINNAMDYDQLPNRLLGSVKFNPEYVEFNLDNYRMKKGVTAVLNDAGKPLHTAHVLDHLLRRPHLIPKEWKEQRVFFTGTVYRSMTGNIYVRYLDFKSQCGWNLGSIKNGDVRPIGEHPMASFHC